MTDAKYKLTPCEIPAVNKATVYEDVAKDFMASKSPSCRVDIAKKKPATIHQGLLKLKRNNREYASVRIVRRGDQVFLAKS